MAKIIINAITHRQSCLYGSDVGAEELYDNCVADYFDHLEEKALAQGFGFGVDWQGQGASSYRVVDEESFNDLQEAHWFMQGVPSFFAFVT